MNLPPLPLIDGALFIDNSGWIESMSTCHRLLQFKSLNLRIPTGEKASLNFGSAIHQALEYRYVKYQNRPVDQQYFDEVSALLTGFYELHPPPTDDWRTLNWAMEVARKYSEFRYPREEFQLLKYGEAVKCPYCDEEVKSQLGPGFGGYFETPCPWCSGTGKRELMVELPFALPLYTHMAPAGDFYPGKDERSIPIFYTGRIDLPIMHNGKLYVMDHKTTGMLGQPFWDKLRVSSQQKGYVWAFQELSKQPVSGYFVNAIRTKEPPQYVLNAGQNVKGKRQSPAEWWTETFQREEVTVSTAQITEWKSNLIDQVEEFFWHYSRGYMPMKTEWCASYGRCSYYDVCHGTEPQFRGAMLASGLFTDNKWSPLNKTNPTQSKQ